MEAILREAARGASFRTHVAALRTRTGHELEFLDITDRVRSEIARSGVTDGIVNVQTQHTTTAIVVNENEPMLLEDLARVLERWAPRCAVYRHDLRERSETPEGKDERVNGHAHARAVALGASETLNVADGRLQIGRWQRIFLVELDGPQERAVSLVVMGAAGSPSPEPRAAAPVRAFSRGEVRP